MVQASAEHAQGNQAPLTATELAVSATNIRTVADFARFMTGLMGAIAAGGVEPDQASAIVSTAQVMLKAVEMQLKFSSVTGHGGHLVLTGDIPEPVIRSHNVTNVTSAPKKQLAPPMPPSRGQKTKEKGPHCVDCYVAHQLYITGTMEEDGESLCLAHFNKRERISDAAVKNDAATS